MWGSVQTPHYAILSALLLLARPKNQIFSSVPCSQNTFSLYCYINVGDQISHMKLWHYQHEILEMKCGHRQEETKLIIR
jgi:hypothetical protein